MFLAYEKLILLAIKKKSYNSQFLKRAKRQIAKEFKISLPRNEDLRKSYFSLLQRGRIKRHKSIEGLLLLKKTRTLSGVSVIAVLTKNYPCKGNCLYCPNEEGMPKSYLSNEPAVMRAVRLNFSPFRQVQERIRILEYNGHDASKIELIIMGGTFSHLPEKYRYRFVLDCYKAANSYKNDAFGKKKSNKIKSLISAYPSNLKLLEIRQLLEKEKNKNAKAKHRLIGLTLETRPDEINLKELKKYREMGCTRVEIGVQSIDNKILDLNERGHGVEESIRATKLLKEMGFKINYHLMPGLWGSNPNKDLRMFKKIFSDSRFQPDMLKIYPCVVTENSRLYNLWKRGIYKPYTNQTFKKLIIKIKKIIPPYVRINRLIRDIPTVSIVAGPNIPNLREILKKEGVKCSCIRCREIGRAPWKDIKFAGKIRMERIDYQASGGKEIFLQYVSGKKKYLHAFLRLRIPAFFLNKKIAPVEELENCGIIREIHSYGVVAPIGSKIAKTSQHKGFGKKLIKEAEKISAKEFKLPKLAVIASEGTKDYYRKLGFRKKGFYLVKSL
jgi:elongator complex protein 3